MKRVKKLILTLTRGEGRRTQFFSGLQGRIGLAA